MTLTTASLVAQTEPTAEVLGVGVLLGIIIGGGMAYHARSRGGSAIIWGLVGFFLGVFGIIVYLGYLFIRSRSDDDPEPGIAESTGPSEPGRSEVAEQGQVKGQRPPGNRPENNTGEQSAVDSDSRSWTDPNDDNQWRRVASELRGGGSEGGTESAAASTGAQSVAGGTDVEPGTADAGSGPGATEQTGNSGADSQRTTDRSPQDGETGVGVGAAGATQTPAASGRVQTGMAVELTYGNGESDLLSGVTHIERDDRALVLTREDGRERRYENARIERIWDEQEG